MRNRNPGARPEDFLHRQSVEQHPDIANLRGDETTHERLRFDREILVEDEQRFASPRADSNPFERGLLVAEKAGLHMTFVGYAPELHAVSRRRDDYRELAEAPLPDDHLLRLKSMPRNILVLGRKASRVDEHRPGRSRQFAAKSQDSRAKFFYDLGVPKTPKPTAHKTTCLVENELEPDLLVAEAVNERRCNP